MDAVLLVVLVNAYKGIVTTELTAAARITQKHFNISEMENFIFYVAPTVELKIVQLSNSLATYGTSITDVPSLLACKCPSDVPELIPFICPY